MELKNKIIELCKNNQDKRTAGVYIDADDEIAIELNSLSDDNYMNLIKELHDEY